MSKIDIQSVTVTLFEDLQIGISEESKSEFENYEKIYSCYYTPLSRYNYQQDFYDLLLNWRRAVKHLSSVAEIAMNPAYQKIIGMGEKVIPLLLRELEKQPDHLFWALKAITGADPISSSQQGNLNEMAQAWLKWAAENGYEW
jgi:hypothetical protein